MTQTLNRLSTANVRNARPGRPARLCTDMASGIYSLAAELKAAPETQTFVVDMAALEAAIIAPLERVAFKSASLVWRSPGRAAQRGRGHLRQGGEARGV